MDYVLVRFTSPEDFAQQAYMECSGGALVGFRDMDGNALTPPRVCEYHILDAYPDRPSWAV